MHPSHFAIRTPDKVAARFVPSGESLTYAELESSANQGAHFFRSAGLNTGDTVALCLGNQQAYLEAVWAAQRAGLIFTVVSTRLSAPELAYIVNDCGAKLLVLSATLAGLAQELRAACPQLRDVYVAGQAPASENSWERAIAQQAATPIADPACGQEMMYSSGTTGRPKGVKKTRPAGAFDQANRFNAALVAGDKNVADRVYLSTAPLYHAAPYRQLSVALSYGATCIVMQRFDAESALQYMEQYRVTHSQWVPTMFYRLLRLPESSRMRYDLSSHAFASHGAAPCAIPLKQAMIDWWGPILEEYYAGTESVGVCTISSHEWLAHQGSVGKSKSGKIVILDALGQELACGETGHIYFANSHAFEYLNDPAKTREATGPGGLQTFGDIGHLDAEGYLYITDRKSFTIVSGGVNIYPQEIENALLSHPAVADAAVFGIPNEEFGEEVKAVVELVEFAHAAPALAQELIEFCRKTIGSLKSPRSLDFEEKLPRHDTGKLYKRFLRDKYLAAEKSA